MAKNHKRIHSQELNLALNLLINKVKRLGLVPDDVNIESSSAPKRRRRKSSYYVQFLLSLGTSLLNNIPPAGVQAIPRLFIREPVHEIFIRMGRDKCAFNALRIFTRLQQLCVSPKVGAATTQGTRELSLVDLL